ncbi:hypothetical protein [Caldalkalibacillus mannanilyticus]|uniref:hypothetical protein n=1 Tax=Caldalkalibacillus mannanilyticus TaxID=1418 RepID=UPI00046959FC|nr:hypothetical protein [Caldalkalibacillus mannanilyticus]
MKKNNLFIVLLMVSILTIVGCSNKENVNVDNEVESTEDDKRSFTLEELTNNWAQALEKLELDYTEYTLEGKNGTDSDGKEAQDIFVFDEVRVVFTGRELDELWGISLKHEPNLSPDIRDLFYKIAIYAVMPNASEKDVQHIFTEIETEEVKEVAFTKEKKMFIKNGNGSFLASYYIN